MASASDKFGSIPTPSNDRRCVEQTFTAMRKLGGYPSMRSKSSAGPLFSNASSEMAPISYFSAALLTRRRSPRVSKRSTNWRRSGIINASIRLVRKITGQFFHACKITTTCSSYIVRRHLNTLVQAFLPCQEIGDGSFDRGMSRLKTTWRPAQVLDTEKAAGVVSLRHRPTL